MKPVMVEKSDKKNLRTPAPKSPQKNVPKTPAPKAEL
jgi:hypothetical protein